MYRNDKGTITVNELDAINWAAKKAGISYGIFVATMKEEDYKAVMEDFCQEMLRRQKIEQARMRAWKAAQHKKPIEEGAMEE